MMMTPLVGMAAFSPLFIDIAAKLGLSVIGTTFSFVWGVEQLFFPYEWALFLILFSYDVFDMKKAMKFCTVRTILSIIFPDGTDLSILDDDWIFEIGEEYENL